MTVNIFLTVYFLIIAILVIEVYYTETFKDDE